MKFSFFFVTKTLRFDVKITGLSFINKSLVSCLYAISKMFTFSGTTLVYAIASGLFIHIFSVSLKCQSEHLSTDFDFSHWG